MRKGLKVLLVGVLLLGLFIYVNNTSRFSRPRTGAPRFFVHRGMAQQFELAQLSSGGCTAAHIASPQHEYLENTIPSMRAAFDRGADVVEIDINATRDGRFAVFHDRRLDCRTNGRGPVRDHTMEELRLLDVGYGYSADGGRTYPFRGKGVGLMPSLDEVFETFPGRSFLIDIKGNNSSDAILLATNLSSLTREDRDRMLVFGGASVLSTIHEKLPDIRTFSTESITACLVRYIAYGWTGVMPGSCANSTVFVPINVMPWLWGWPNRFIDRFESQGSSVIAMGAFGGPDFPAGIDTLEQVRRLPRDFNGGIWTNELDLIKHAVLQTDRSIP